MRRLLLGLVGLAVLGGSVAVGLWWIDHDPLTITALDPPEGAEERREPDGTVLAVPYRDAALVPYTFRVRNEGEVTVRIHAVDPHATYGHRLLRPAGFELGSYDPAVSVAADHVVPLRPFDLAEGEEASITVIARMQDCEFSVAGSGQRYEGHALRFGFGPLRKTVRLTFPTPLSVRSPGAAGTLGATGACPREEPPEDVRMTPYEPGFRPDRIVVPE